MPEGSQNNEAREARETYPSCPRCGREAVCPRCGEVASYQTPFDKMFWDSNAHYWRCECQGEDA